MSSVLAPRRDIEAVVGLALTKNLGIGRAMCTLFYKPQHLLRWANARSLGEGAQLELGGVDRFYRHDACLKFKRVDDLHGTAKYDFSRLLLAPPPAFAADVGSNQPYVDAASAL